MYIWVSYDLKSFYKKILSFFCIFHKKIVKIHCSFKTIYKLSKVHFTTTYA